MKIVSLAPSNTEILYKIGARENIIATTSLCDYPEQAAELPSVGGWTNLDVKKVAELDPDLALASDDLQDDIVDQLKTEGVEVKQFKPKTVKEVLSSIREIGELTDRRKKAEALVGKMRREISSIEINGERIYCEEWSDPPMVSGNWVPGLIERINGEYIIDEGLRSRKIEDEEIKDFNPDYIFLNVCGAGEKASRDKIINRNGWQSLKAVRNENVFVIDDSLLNRPGPRIVRGAQKIAEVVNQN